MRIRIFLIYIFIFISRDLALSQSKNYPFINPTPGEISIVACSPVTEGINPSHALYEDVVDCGFNMITLMGSVDFFKQQFELIGDLNLKVVVNNGNLRGVNISWFVNALKHSPYIGAWSLYDEPSVETLLKIKDWCEELYKIDPEHLMYINLVGMLSKPFTGNFTNLSQYYKYVQKMIRPGVWSYDFYPIITENGKLSVYYDNFYSDLETFHSLSIKTQRPFWAYCESMVYSTKWNSRPVATAEYLCFEAFSALAYGAQGIVYWSYGMRNSNEIEDYKSALVDRKGNKTPAWFAAQKVNRDIKKFNEVFYQCNVKRVRHTGDKLYKGTKKLSGKIGPFRKIESSESGVLISEIENNGKNYIVIVNHDVFKNQKIILDLSPGRSVKDISSDVEISYQGSKSIVLNLDKGGYVIFQEV